MSGQPFYKKESLRNGISRRAFLLKAGIVTSGILLSGCIKKIKPGNSYKNIKGSIKGPNAKAGHILRDKTPLPVPTEARKVKTLIIGSGISGLSAARWLKIQGHHDFELIELEDHIGGNSHSGSNAVSSYPLGAHYVTIANNEDELLLDFFQECGAITHYEKGLPVYDEYYLCFDPEERLLINGQWQEGLVPDFGIKPEDRDQIKRFFRLIDNLKQAKGTDGRYAFDIPLDNSSADEKFRDLDKSSFKEYLKQEGYTSPYLLWYLNYCCKDDYGQQTDKVSAWAGLHYFAARRGKAANAESNAVLTWPEGNGWLMKKLAEGVKEHVKQGAICYHIATVPNGGIIARMLDLKTNKTYTIEAEKAILATPQFVNQKIFEGAPKRGFSLDKLHYSPWFIANITLNNLPQGKGAGLCWDNVPYNTASVGYVNANQQHVNAVENKKVITYYLPLCDYEPRVARLAAYTRTYQQWLDIVIPELEYIHPGITDNIEQVDGWIWGHGMIAPDVNYIWGADRKNAQQPIDGSLFFAHTDLSGISIFEEAFHQGIKAAKQVLSSYV
ncbi:NAD(P)/FAD-dependent oxidoreductase [Mucilaginibacter gynuensis]|uniref:NAD(P)/FAD-dependent oxidoreductase n=1 Tax=Mucilaginibacter gynuensis TaxID=1302236 RepID=A0ABP8H7A1_9SPHI